nr:hypothetical protein [uncultured Sphaerochaeta sp.]
MKNLSSDFSKRAVDLSKSPLGIIALFIVLVYSIAGIVFGFSINELVGSERLFLLCFIVFFPVLVLIAFFVLVTKFPNCLYPRSEFDSDEGFYRYQNNFERNLITQNKAMTIQIDNSEKLFIANEQKTSIAGLHAPTEIKDMPTSGNTESTPKKSKKNDIGNEFAYIDEIAPMPRQKALGEVPPIIDGPGQRMELARRIAYAENLVFEDLERKYKTRINKHIVLNCGPFDSIGADGHFIDKKTGDDVIVEIRYFQGDFYKTVIEECIPRALKKSEADFFSYPLPIILYVVVDSIDNELFEKYQKEIEKHIKSFPNSMTLIINRVSDLEKKSNQIGS